MEEGVVKGTKKTLNEEEKDYDNISWSTNDEEKM